MLTITPTNIQNSPFKYAVKGELPLSDVLDMMRGFYATQYVCHAIYNIIHGINRETVKYSDTFIAECDFVDEWMEEANNIPYIDIADAASVIDNQSRNITLQICNYMISVLEATGGKKCAGYDREAIEKVRRNGEFNMRFSRKMALTAILEQFPNATFQIDFLMINYKPE